MELFGNAIDKSMMPSYIDFKRNPSHLFQLKQERISQLLSAPTNNVGQPQPITGQPVQQSNRWNQGQNNG